MHVEIIKEYIKLNNYIKSVSTIILAMINELNVYKHNEAYKIIKWLLNDVTDRTHIILFKIVLQQTSKKMQQNLFSNCD